MRLAFEDLGGAWVKLGQMLAMRFDLLPAEYCDELFKLLNDVQPFPYSDVCEIVRQELGGPPEDVFRTFEPKPFASASIGQVHRAHLPLASPSRSRCNGQASVRGCGPTLCSCTG